MLFSLEKRRTEGKYDLVSSQSILVSVSRTDDYRPKSRPRDLEIETSVNGERDSSVVRASES